MKACIYNPYLDTLGGGERYTLSFAKVLQECGYDVDVEWNDQSILNRLEDRFGMDLKGINIIPDIKKGDGYDLCFWVSDGSIPLMHGRVNILHFQVPFHGVNGKSLMNKMKLFRVNRIVCNSNFTKRVIDKEFGIDSVVIYPPVDTESFKSKRKENIILYVGRFSGILQNKGQDILITCFKRICDEGLKDWKLVLAGGIEVGVGSRISELRKLAEGYPIEFYESPDFKTLKTLYGKAKIFWSASGFGWSEQENPEKMEHFGITVVEAMSAGVVPVVFDGGGHKEITENGVSGILWKSEDELVAKSIKLIKNNKQLNAFEINAKKKAINYDVEKFKNKVLELLK